MTCALHDPDTFGNAVSPHGAGIHACPGALLMRLELRVFMDEWLSHTDDIATVPEKSAMRAVYSGSGYSILPLRIR